MILGIDLGASTGWVILDNGRYISGGTNVLKISSKETKAARWIKYRTWVIDILERVKPTSVAVEDVSRHSGVHAAHAYGYYRYVLEAECLLRNVPVISLSVGQWKKLAVGKGNAKKPEVAERLQKVYPIEFETEDHSDALGIAIAAEKLLS